METLCIFKTVYMSYKFEIILSNEALDFLETQKKQSYENLHFRRSTRPSAW